MMLPPHRLKQSACFVLYLLVWSWSAQAEPTSYTQSTVSIWSEGTRIAGDLLRPADLAPDQKVPGIVMSHGWGGTKASLNRIAKQFAKQGYMVLVFDYRGWGESDSRMVIQGRMPEPDHNGLATVQVQLVREVINPVDQLMDIRRAFDFIEGEPNIDRSRLAYWGSSFSGGYAISVAANETRVKCVVGQVPSADGLDILQTVYKDKNIIQRAQEDAIKRARGEIPPVPQGTHIAPNLRGSTIEDLVVGHSPVAHASKITKPILLIDAENEELFDRKKNGALAIERAGANGAITKYHVMPGITHYGIYRGEAEKTATSLAIEWFKIHL